ncbi:MAG: hypothetical protein RLZ26_55 [Pseudomonadota bacterium]
MHGTFQQVSSLREEIFQKTLIANKAAYLVELPWNASLTDMLDLFESEKGGVWCAGAAFVFFKACIESGIDAHIYFFGFPGGFTHVTNLIKIGDDLFIHDAYLNFYFETPFFDLLSQISEGNTVMPIHGNALRRPVLAESINTIGWISEGEGKSPWRESRPGFRVYSAEMSLGTFHQKYKEPDLEAAIARVGNEGLPRDIFSLLLYPFGLTGKAGWVDDPHSELDGGLFGRIVAECDLLRQRTQIRTAG